jgi:Tfp pilus assembly protein PilO
MKDLLAQELRKPYGPLLPWVGLVVLLLLLLGLVRSIGAVSAQQGVLKLEADWLQARKDQQWHQDALRARKDLARVWAALPEERDFAPLALGITEEAKRNHVTLPALSYKTEPTPVPQTSKGILQGTMTGKYEHLRRFLYEIETAEELVYVEDLDLVPSVQQKDQVLTFNIRIATYLRGESGKPAAL